MTTPLDVPMPWAATGRFPDTVEYRRPNWSGSLIMPAGITMVDITWSGTARLSVALEDASLGDMVRLGNAGLRWRAVCDAPVALRVQGLSIVTADLARRLGVSFIPLPMKH